MKTIMKKVLLGFGMFLSFVIAGLFLTGNKHIFRALSLTYLKGQVTANINDHRDFSTNIIKSGQETPWQLHNQYNQKELSKELLDFLQKYNSAAFLIIKDGKIHTEKYFEPYNENSKTNSFSMAKTILTMMVGAAIDEGKISNFDVLLDSLVPELTGKANGVTLAHLSAMTSGIDWDEHYYSPFSPTPKLLYGYNVKDFSLSRKYIQPAGKEFYYASVSTQVLAVALQNTIGEQSLSEYLSAKFWQPLGMNDDALWHTDSQGFELAFCCISSNARNFAKLGQLLLQKGEWQGRQLLSKNFIEKMQTPTKVHYYGHSLWIDERDQEQPQFYSFNGHLGQYIIVVPSHNMIVLRLGETRGQEPDNVTNFIHKEIPFFVEQALELTKED